MKKIAALIIIGILMSFLTNNAFAHWKCDLAGVVVQDPAPEPFKSDLQ